MKTKVYRAKKSVIRNTKRANKAKKRNYNRVIQQTPNGAKLVRAFCPSETTRDFEHGPSLVIEYDKDGKVKNFNSWSKNNKQNMSKMAQSAQKDYKFAANSKKEAVKKILQNCGYDPTIKYTRKEKKRFTRAVKEKLFNLTTIVKREFYNREALKKKYSKVSEQTPHATAVNTTIAIKERSKTKALTAKEINKETHSKRKFTYIINRVVEADMNAKKEGRPYKNYDFLTDYFEADTVKSAEKKAANLAKKYLKDESFAGVTLKDPEGLNMTTYLHPDKISRLAA